MRILYLTTGFPWPLTSGYLRHYFFIRELAQRHRVTLLSLARPGYADEHLEALKPLTESVQVFGGGPSCGSFSGRTLRRVRRVAGQTPAVRQMRSALVRLLNHKRFDAVLFSGRETFPAVRAVRGLPVVADICDAASVRIRGQMDCTALAYRPWLMLEYARMRWIEQSLIKTAAHVLFASCRDRDALLGGPSERATVVPNGVDLEYWRRGEWLESEVRGQKSEVSGQESGVGYPKPAGGAPPETTHHSPLTTHHSPRPAPAEPAIVFTGAMGYGPNVDCALYLIREILPLVRRSVPQARLWIVGRDPTAELREAGRQPGVTVTGFVDDVRPWLEGAAVFGAPIRFGAGIQNKLLEALAMEVPVVTSSLAADGLRTENGPPPPIEVADRPDEFAAALCRKLSGSAQRTGLKGEGRRFVQEHFDWRTSGERLERILAAAVESGVQDQRIGPCSALH